MPITWTNVAKSAALAIGPGSKDIKLTIEGIKEIHAIIRLAIRNDFTFLCPVSWINPADAGNGTIPIVENNEEIICDIPPTHTPRFSVCFSFSLDNGATCFTAETAAIVFATKRNVNKVAVRVIPISNLGMPQANICGNLTSGVYEGI